MNISIRPASLKDLPAIEALYRGQATDGEKPAQLGVGIASPKRQFASTRLWALLNNTFASILPMASAADHVYVGEGLGSGIAGFVQAETAPAGKHVWQILNLCLRPDLDRFQMGTALLDHLCNEGLRRGASKFIIRLAVGDPMAELFRARGFRAYATEHALLAEMVVPRSTPELEGWRPLRRQDQLALYLLYRSVTPKEVSAVEGASFDEWRQGFQQGWWTSRLPRPAKQRQFVVDKGQVIGWMGIRPGSGTRPHTLGLMALPEPDLLSNLVQRSLSYVAQHRPGPVWTTLRHYDEKAIQLLQQEGFDTIASELLMVRELALRVPVRIRARVKEKKLVPQYG